MAGPADRAREWRLVRRAIKVLVLVAVCAVVAPVTAAVVALGTLLLAPLPAALPEPRPLGISQPSHVYLLERDGVRRQIAVFREFEQNLPIRREDIPQVLKNAVVAAEDKGFFRHHGVDFRGSLRALLADLRSQSVVQGGSTITQQYVRNTYVTRERTVSRKIREAMLARQLDREMDKEEILFRYLSGIYLGEGAYGVEAASATYFRKPVSQLSISEAALLAGLIPAPSRYEPRGNPTLAESKRQLVLQKMHEEGYLTKPQLDEAMAQRTWLASQGPPPGPATVVHPPHQETAQFPYFVDYVRRYLIAKYGPSKVFRGGMDVTVTLDPVTQARAEETVARHLAGTKPPLEMSLVAVEPSTGHVKALVGGRDFVASQVNLALGGCPPRPAASRLKVEVDAPCWSGQPMEGGGTGRQPGSAFKPFVLTTALSHGMLPTKTYSAPSVFRIPNCRTTPGSPGRCTIGNAEGGGGGSADLRHATVASVNTVYAQVVRDVGCKQTAETARRMGLSAAWYSPQFHTCSGTYALGVIDVSPLDMASAYGVLAARGRRAEATPVIRVVEPGPGGAATVLEDNGQPQLKQVVPEVVADTVTDILRGVITNGTGRAADIGRPAAGKTGTGQNYTNAWFVGYTPSLSTAVWMGHSNNQSTPLHNIKGNARVYGGTIPARAWHDFMLDALAGVPPTEFSEPPPPSSLAELLRAGALQARAPGPLGGVAPGPRRSPVGTGVGGPYEDRTVPPVAVSPPAPPAPETGAQPSPPEPPVTPPAQPPPEPDEPESASRQPQRRRGGGVGRPV
jgi:penicillin-binding protein 1A